MHNKNTYFLVKILKSSQAGRLNVELLFSPHLDLSDAAERVFELFKPLLGNFNTALTDVKIAENGFCPVIKTASFEAKTIPFYGLFEVLCANARQTAPYLKTRLLVVDAECMPNDSDYQSMDIQCSSCAEFSYLTQVVSAQHRQKEIEFDITQILA